MKVSGQLHDPAALPLGKNPVSHRVGDCVSATVSPAAPLFCRSLNFIIRN